MAFVSGCALPASRAAVDPHVALRAGVRPVAARRAAATLQMAKEVDFPELNGKPFRIGIVSSRWNAEMIDTMRNDIVSTLKENGVEDDNIVEFKVPGSWELPLAARFVSITQKVDAIVVLGVLVKGDTSHYEYIAENVSRALMDVQVSSAVPIVFGVLTCLTEEQAAYRSLGPGSHAKDWALTAIEMATLRASQMNKPDAGKQSKIGFGQMMPPDAKPGSSSAPARKVGF